MRVRAGKVDVAVWVSPCETGQDMLALSSVRGGGFALRRGREGDPATITREVVGDIAHGTPFYCDAALLRCCTNIDKMKSL